MSIAIPACRTFTVFAFRGSRSKAAAAAFQRTIDEGKHGSGPGPTSFESLLFFGHAGLSADDGTTILGFNPDGGALQVWEVLGRLRNGDAFPGVVRDDTAVFSAAPPRGLIIRSFEVLLPEPQFQEIERRLDGERRSSQYSYGFPNGDGDCNCITWLERLGLPLFTGRMNEFIGLVGIHGYRRRRFGRCL